MPKITKPALGAELIGRVALAVSVVNQKGANPNVALRMADLVNDLADNGVAVVRKDWFDTVVALAETALAVMPMTGRIVEGVFYRGDEPEVDGEAILARFSDAGLIIKTGHGYVPAPHLLAVMPKK